MVYFDEKIPFGKNVIDFVLFGEEILFENFHSVDFLCFVLFNQENLTITSFTDDCQEGKVIDGFFRRLDHEERKGW